VWRILCLNIKNQSNRILPLTFIIKKLVLTRVNMSKKALETMQELLYERLGIDKDKVTLDASLEDLGIDSLMQIELLFDFEDKYKVKIPDLTVRPTTIGALIAVVEPFVPKS